MTAPQHRQPDGPEAIVAAWIDAYNARDLAAMLACLHPDVDYLPLRLGGLTRPHRGHDGVRDWWTRLDPARYAHAIDVLDIRAVDDGIVLAAGTLRIADLPDIAPFSAVYHTTDGLIHSAKHYLTDPDLLDRVNTPP